MLPKTAIGKICCLIIKYSKHKNPAIFLEFTPLHLAAQNGQLKMCQLIIGNVADKNPKALGWTTLHFDAPKGQIEICKLIHEKTYYRKNPVKCVGKHQKAWRTH